jgi:hypothetical protein
MSNQLDRGIAYKPLPEDLFVIEKEKSQLLLEAHMLKTQSQLSEAADRFAQAARYEEQLMEWAAAQGLDDLYYLHSFSALSCWAQAGDPHRALQMSHTLLDSVQLTKAQRAQLQNYKQRLEQRWISWMEQWSTSALAAD